MTLRIGAGDSTVTSTPTCGREFDVAEVVPYFCGNYVAYDCRDDKTLVLAPAFDDDLRIG